MGTAVCAKCTHFRRAKPASQLLAKAVGAEEGQVADALAKVVADEQKVRDAEAQFKRAQASKEDPTKEDEAWGTRPIMSEYCGLREADGVFLIAEVKNRGGNCRDFTPGTPERRACATCTHRVPARGPSLDQEHERAYTGMAVDAIAVRGSTSVPEALLNKYREGVATRKALEVSGAYHAQGIMAMEPSYLDWCRHFSTEDSYAVCAIQNPHATCPGWEPTVADKPAQAQTVSAPKDDRTPDVRSVPSAPDSTYQGASTKEVVHVQRAGSGMASEGPVPLTEEMVEEVVGFLEWILDVRIPGDARELLRASLIDTWRNGRTVEMQNVQNYINDFQGVKASDEETQVFLRESNQQQFVAALRAESDQLSQVLLALYDAVNAPVVPGEPPLTQEAVNSSLELLNFMGAVVQGAPPSPIPPQSRAAWLNHLISVSAMLPPHERNWLASAPLLWAHLRVAWRQMSDQERGFYRQQWAQQLAGSPFAGQWNIGQGQGFMQPQPSYGGYSPQPGPVYGGAMPVSSSANIGSKDDLLQTILQEQQKQLEEAEKIDPKLALLKKLQNDQTNAQMLSNISSMMHETTMAIVKNIK